MTKDPDIVRHCVHCGTRTWHHGDTCEWSDGHKKTECETLPVQKSGLARAEHGGGGADPIQREAAAPTSSTTN